MNKDRQTCNGYNIKVIIKHHHLECGKAFTFAHVCAIQYTHICCIKPTRKFHSFCESLCCCYCCCCCFAPPEHITKHINPFHSGFSPLCFLNALLQLKYECWNSKSFFLRLIFFFLMIQFVEFSSHDQDQESGKKVGYAALSVAVRIEFYMF